MEHREVLLKFHMVSCVLALNTYKNSGNWDLHKEGWELDVVKVRLDPRSLDRDMVLEMCSDS